MLTLRIVCIGKLKEGFFREAAAEYQKRLSRFCRVEIVELSDEKAPESLSAAQRRQVVEAEGARILEKLSGYVVALCIDAPQCDSVALARKLERLTQLHSTITFVIGGSLGLSSEVIRRADETLSFSPMTFAHGLFRVMLLEQLYRAQTITAGHTYHK